MTELDKFRIKASLMIMVGSIGHLAVMIAAPMPVKIAALVLTLPLFGLWYWWSYRQFRRIYGTQTPTPPSG